MAESSLRVKRYREKQKALQQPGESRVDYIKRRLGDPLLIARIEREPNGCTPERWEAALKYQDFFNSSVIPARVVLEEKLAAEVAQEAKARMAGKADNAVNRAASGATVANESVTAT
jgi:hypothetical protein